MRTFIKKLLLGRRCHDNFDIFSEVHKPHHLDTDLSICVKYKHSKFADVKFTWKINTNIIYVNNHGKEFIPHSVLNKALDYVYGYFHLHNEPLPVLSVAPFDHEMMYLATLRGTQIHNVDDSCRHYALHGSSIDIDRYSHVYEELPVLHMPSKPRVFYSVTKYPTSYMLKAKNHVTRGTSVKGVLLFPTPELAILDFIANRKTIDSGSEHDLHLYKVNAGGIEDLITPQELICRQRVYDAHITRLHLSTTDVNFDYLGKLIVLDDGELELMIRAYDNTIVVKHSNVPITIMGL